MMTAQGVYWLGFAFIMGLAVYQRTLRLDMPPIDFPADRQRSNMYMVQAYAGDLGLFNRRGSWLELWLMPWLTARTRWLCTLLGVELWTLARLWSSFFGLFAVGFAALAGFWAAAREDAPLGRRYRISLLLMLGMALNPYHVFISRMISTESTTIAMQMGALALFWVAYRHPRRWFCWFLFFVFFVLSGWTKIPSLIWLPAYFVYLLFKREIPFWLRLGGVCVLAAGTGAVFWVYNVNPFAVFESYAAKYAHFADQAQDWMSNELWIKTYVSRTVLMLTLPGVFFAIVGFLNAPWLFRLTMVVFLVLFYRLVNLNTYNFCHAIIPGMALATWGVNSFLEVGARDRLGLFGGRGPMNALSARLATQIPVLIIIGAVFALLMPLGPKYLKTPEPRGDVLQAIEVIPKNVHTQGVVVSDDGEGSLAYMLGQQDRLISTQFELRTGYYYAVRLFGGADKASQKQQVRSASGAWVKWANLPGEPNGILYTRRPDDQDRPNLDQYIEVPGDRTKMDWRPKLEAETFHVPKQRYDGGRRVLHAHPGEQLKIGVTWDNPQGYEAAAMRWSNSDLRRLVPVPIRVGGYGIQYSGLLCLPEGSRPTAFYTFDLPKHFPVGHYYMNFFAIEDENWHNQHTRFRPLPFVLIVEALEKPKSHWSWKYRELYSLNHQIEPRVWSDHRTFRNMELEGYRTDSPLENVFSCPGSPPGVYEIAVRGEGTPITSPDDPGNVWPAVEVYISSEREQPAATVRIASEKTGVFTAEFTAFESFDALRLHSLQGRGRIRRKPLWMIDFIPATYGKQIVTLRGAELRLKRPLFPPIASASLADVEE